VVVLAEVLALVAAGSGWQLSTDPRLFGQPLSIERQHAWRWGVAGEA
jgi:hypothetical protein